MSRGALCDLYDIVFLLFTTFVVISPYSTTVGKCAMDEQDFE